MSCLASDGAEASYQNSIHGVIREELRVYVNSHPEEGRCQEVSNQNFDKHFTSLKILAGNPRTEHV